MGLFKRAEEVKIESTIEQQETQEFEDTLLQATRSDHPVTKNEALNIPAFAACVNKIADTVASIPIKLFKYTDGKVEEQNDPRVRLLNSETGDTLDAFQLKRAMVVDMLLDKGGYAYINRENGEISSIHYVDATNVSFNSNYHPIYKDYKVLVQDMEFNPFQFIMLLRNTKNGYAGKSIVDENEKVLTMTYNAMKFENTLVSTGGNRKGFLLSPRKLSKEIMKQLKQSFRSLYSNNTENVIVLNEGIQFKESSNSCVEMQLSENKELNNNDICKLFNIPPTIINGGVVNEEDKKLFIDTILTVLTRFEAAINKSMLKEREKDQGNGSYYFFAFDTNEITKGDIEKRFRSYKLAVENGFMQVDEVRRKENLPELGLQFIKLGLQDVLFDPKTGNVYTPNTGQTGNINGANAPDNIEKIDNLGGDALES